MIRDISLLLDYEYFCLFYRYYSFEYRFMNYSWKWDEFNQCDFVYAHLAVDAFSLPPSFEENHSFDIIYTLIPIHYRFFLFYPLKAMLNTEYKSRLFRCLYQIQLDLKPFEASNILIRYPLTEIDHLIFSVACIDIKRRTSIHLFDSICFVCFFNCTIPENEKIVEISHHSLDEKKEKKEKM